MVVCYERSLALKTLLLHPGTQYSHRLACQLQRLGYLHKFVTGIAFVKNSPLLSWLPQTFNNKLSNRILDCSITEQQLVNVSFPELLALYRLWRGYEMEEVMNQRNEQFQNNISGRLIEEVESVIGFDTSSWIVAAKTKKLKKPYFLDQSIAHPVEKYNLFTELRKKYPKWADDIPEKKDSFILQEVQEYELAHKIVVASSFTRDSLVKYNIPLHKIIVNAYGVSDSFFNLNVPMRSGKIRFVFLGLLGARKGLPFLIEAWMENELFKNSELWLAGPSSRFAEDAVRNTPGMFYKGRISYKHIPDLLSLCDCLIFPSFFEGFGQVILEAMAIGLPVITTQATAGPDIIENGVDGFVIATGNKKELAATMHLMSENPSMCRNMGKLAREKARSFSWDAYGDRWKSILNAE